MENPLISVIVPIYKVEQYLDKCITSIVNQTYKNLEIILVDDGSPDNCPTICDKWKELDNRIIVIHKENGGLSDARNAGLDICKGDYIAFVDSDDYIHLDMYNELITTMLKHNCDIVQCEHINVYENQEVESHYSNYIYKEYNVEEALHSLILESPLRQVVWNKLYKRNIFDNLRFEVGKLNEDDFFTYQAFHICKKVGYINKVLYYYLIRNSSIMGTTFNIRRLDGLEARMNRYSFLKENYIHLASIDKKVLWFYILYVYQKVLKIENIEVRKKASLRIKNYFNLIKNDSIFIKNMSFKTRIWIYLSLISLDLICNIRNILQINCD